MTYSHPISERPQQSVEKSAGFASWSLREQAECQKKMAISLENIDSSLRRIASSILSNQKKIDTSVHIPSHMTDEIPF